jgi:hypothetical protein
MPRAQIIRLDDYRRMQPPPAPVREPASTFRLIQLFRAPPVDRATMLRKLGHRLAEQRRRDPV